MEGFYTEHSRMSEYRRLVVLQNRLNAINIHLLEFWPGPEVRGYENIVKDMYEYSDIIQSNSRNWRKQIV